MQILTYPNADFALCHSFSAENGDFFMKEQSRKKATSHVSQKALRFTTRAVAYTALMTALVYVGTLVGYSGNLFYFNLGDSVILIAAALLGPVSGAIAGGLGAFLGDLTVYPVTMLFTLARKYIEGLAAGLLFRIIYKKYDKCVCVPEDERGADYPLLKRKADVLKIVFSCLAGLLSTAIMFVGYFICQTFMYGTYAGAIVALPFDVAQGVISTAVAILCLYALKLENFRYKLKNK